MTDEWTGWRTLIIDYTHTLDCIPDALVERIIDLFGLYDLKVEGASDGPYEPVPVLESVHEFFDRLDAEDAHYEGPSGPSLDEIVAIVRAHRDGIR